MSKMIRGEKETEPFEAAFDYVIVGSGAAGATAARVLVDYGHQIAVVEEGPALPTGAFGDSISQAFTSLYRGKGAQTTRGREAIAVLQGVCLGGTTVINSGIIWRMPEDVWAPWKEIYGLENAIPLERLHQNWDQIENELSVHPVESAVWGEQNRLMDKARQSSGLSGGALRRNEKGCQGSARCFHGCPHGAKQSMLVSYLPYAAQHGAALISGARVERILLRGRRAVGVRGHFISQDSSSRKRHPFRIHARKGVLVAASAIQTPLLLQRSGLRNRHLGQHLQGHPGISMIGLFDQPVNMWFGATQGYEVDHFRQSEGFKVETIALSPELVFAQMPGIGPEWVANLAQTGYMAAWGLLLRSQAQGHVKNGLLGTEIYFSPTPGDMQRLRRAMQRVASLLFAAGARQVLPLVFGVPERLCSPEEAARLEDAPLDPANYAMTMSHMFGTARMSVRSQDGVVGTDFSVHGLEGLYVIDSSIFPTNLGVNPQLSIMGIAMHAAQTIVEQA